MLLDRIDNHCQQQDVYRTQLDSEFTLEQGYYLNYSPFAHPPSLKAYLSGVAGGAGAGYTLDRLPVYPRALKPSSETVVFPSCGVFATAICSPIFSASLPYLLYLYFPHNSSDAGTTSHRRICSVVEKLINDSLSNAASLPVTPSLMCFPVTLLGLLAGAHDAVFFFLPLSCRPSTLLRPAAQWQS